MGIVYPGINKPLALEIVKQYSVKNFVETGTYKGDTALWASAHFERVFTIEMAESLWNKNREQYAHVENVRFFLGDSREHLVKIRDGLDAPAIYWLDAHWSGGPTYGESDECPLMNELDEINKSI